LLGCRLAAEELAQGCASTALSIQHALSSWTTQESRCRRPPTKGTTGEDVVQEGKLIGGNFSEPTTSGWWHAGAAHAGPARRRGYRITGRKAFASMIAAADYVMVMA